MSDEKFSCEQEMLLFDPNATWKKTLLAGGTYELRELLIPIFKNGVCVYQSPSLMEIQDNCKKELATLWDESKRLINPNEVHVDLSPALFQLKNELIHGATK